MAVARGDFYGKEEKLVSPEKTENGLCFNDIAAFGVPRAGLRCGEVLRFVCKTFRRVLSFKKMEDKKSLLEKTTVIMWAECHGYF